MSKRMREEASDESRPSTMDSELIRTNAPLRKYLQMTEDDHIENKTMKCSLPGHQEALPFQSFEDFEIHYSQFHAHRCPECRKNFPSELYLDLHIGENHDPLAEARRAKGEKTYRCFVDGCDKICIDPHKRKLHLKDKHMFPKNYDFLVVNTGIDKKSSMLRSGNSKARSTADKGTRQGSISGASTATDAKESSSHEDTSLSSASPPDVPGPQISKVDTDLDNITATMSSLRFVPPSVRLARGGGRGGSNTS